MLAIAKQQLHVFCLTVTAACMDASMVTLPQMWTGSAVVYEGTSSLQPFGGCGNVCAGEVDERQITLFYLPASSQIRSLKVETCGLTSIDTVLVVYPIVFTNNGEFGSVGKSGLLSERMCVSTRCMPCLFPE